MTRIVLPLLTLALSLAPVLGRAADPKADEAKAVAEIEKLGGEVTRDEKSPGKPVISVRWVRTATDAGLKHLEGLPQLKSLDLMDSHMVSDAGLVHLKGLTQLQVLDLFGTNVTDAGLERLKALPQLQALFLAYARISDAGLEHLKVLTNLRSLGLISTKVTDAGLVHLKGLSQLHLLSLMDSTEISDAGLLHLEGLTKLQKLDLRKTRVTAAGVQGLQKVLPNCEIRHYPIPVLPRAAESGGNRQGYRQPTARHSDGHGQHQ